MSYAPGPSFSIPKRIADERKDVWTEYNQIYHDYNPVHLGLGFADYVVTNYFNEVLAEVVINAGSSLTQYARSKVRAFLCKLPTIAF